MMFLSFLLRACKKKNNNLVKYNALKLSYDFDLPGVISQLEEVRALIVYVGCPTCLFFLMVS